MLTITFDQMLEAIKRAVAERGEDFVYPDDWRVKDHPAFPNTCVYFNDDGSRSCIIGMAMGYIDPKFPLTEFKAIGENFEAATKTGILEIEEDAANLATIVQDEQDSNVPWGLALENAMMHFDYRTKA